VDQKTVYGQATLYIPSFCVVEVFNALARKHFRDGLARKAYENSLKRFRDDIHWGKTLYSYELNSYHIIGADEIIPIEHHVASEDDRDHLTTFDILIIAMASELAYVGRRDDTFLVTCDRRMKRVVDQFRAVSSGNRESWVVPGPLGSPDKRRWIPRNVLYLRALRPWEITPARRQARLNL
jgi:hypothetical protein